MAIDVSVWLSERLQSGAFQSVSPRRVYLGMNRIASMDRDTFAGVEDTLELLDLERNKLTNISTAFDRFAFININDCLGDNFTTKREAFNGTLLH